MSAANDELSTGEACPPMDEGYVVGLIRGIAEDMASQKDSPWMTLREAARYARCATDLIVMAVNVGELPSYVRTAPSGRKSRFVNKDEVDEWMRRDPYKSPWAVA